MSLVILLIGDDFIFETFFQMLRDTNLLIIDHNTFRYHTYDMIAALLLDEKIGPHLFESFKDEFKLFVDAKTIWERVILVKNMMKSYDLSEVFTAFDADDQYPARYMKSLELFLREEKESGKVNVTNTDLYGRLTVPLEKDSINIHVLRHKYETYDMRLPKRTKYYTCSNLFNTKMLLNFINDHSINAVILDNAEIAASLSLHTKDTTFIFGNYRYNYVPDKDPKIGMFRGMEIIANTERIAHNEFGVFDPFPIPEKYVRKVE